MGVVSQFAVSTACLEADKQWHVARGLTPQTMLCSDRSRRVPLAMASPGATGEGLRSPVLCNLK